MTRVPDDEEGAWDALRAATGSGAGASAPGAGPGQRATVLLIDDADSLVARFGREHQQEFVDLLIGIIRDGPRRGTTVVLTAQRLPPLLQPAAVLCDSVLMLRLPNRQEHLLAGGRGDDFDPDLPPGGGFWRGDRVQVGYVTATPPPGDVRPGPPAIELHPGGRTAVVTRSPARLAADLSRWAEAGQLTAPGGVRVVAVAAAIAGSGDPDELRIAQTSDREPAHTILLGDPEAWQSAWALLAAVRRSTPLVFDGCAVGEFRAISGDRRLPPPISPGSVWLLSPGGELRRAGLGPRE